MSDFPDLSSVVNRQHGQGFAQQGPMPMPPQQGYPPPGAYGDPTAPQVPPVAMPPMPTEPPTNWGMVAGRVAAGLALVGAVVGVGYALNKGEFSANDDDDEDDDDMDDEDEDGDVDEAEEILRQTPRPSSAFAPNPARRGRR